MTPNQMQNNAAAIKKLYDEAEAIMLKKMADGLIGDSYDVLWYNRKMAEINDMRSAISAELQRLEKDSKNMRDGYIVTAYNQVVKDFESDNRQYLSKTGSTPEARMNAIVRLIQEQDATFNAVNSAILRDTQDEYRSIIGKVVAMQATGTITTQEAIKKALNDFAERGIIGFTDKAGRKWEMGSYAEMAVRTGMMNARVEAYKDEMAAHGEHLVIISDHQDTCPLCADWERSILSVDGQGLNDPECDGLLDDAVAAGLFHPNCGHSMTVYVKGLTDKSSGKSRQGYTKEQDEEGYKNRQIQRSLERKERMWKREMAVAQGYGDAERERFCYDKAMMYRDRIETLVNTTGLPRKKGREGGIVKLSDAAAKVPRTVQSELGRKLQEANISSIVNGKDITATWTRRADKFKFEIEDVLNAQGFDGKPRLMSREEFEKAVAAANDGHGFIAQRTYSAPDQQILDEYRDQLYNGKWYVDCSTGGAQYGQGMYCAADYNGALTDGIKAEMQHYIELQDNRIGYRQQQAIVDAKAKYADEQRQHILNEITNPTEQAMLRREFLHIGTPEDRKLLKSLSDNEYDTMVKRVATVYDRAESARQQAMRLDDKQIADMFGISKHAPNYVETFTLDKSAKVITYEEIFDKKSKYRDEYISRDTEKIISRELEIIGLSDNKNAITFTRFQLGYGDVDWDTASKAHNSLSKEQLSDINLIQPMIKEAVSKAEIEYYQMDIGSFAAMLGYDAINAEGHGQSGSYTVILNRTKVIILKED